MKIETPCIQNVFCLSHPDIREDGAVIYHLPYFFSSHISIPDRQRPSIRFQLELLTDWENGAPFL